MLSLDEIAGDPAKLATLPLCERNAVLLKCAAILSGAAATDPDGQLPRQPERLLTPEEAGTRMSQTPNWMKRNAISLPFARKVGRSWRFVEAGLDAYLAQRARR